MITIRGAFVKCAVDVIIKVQIPVCRSHILTFEMNCENKNMKDISCLLVFSSNKERGKIMIYSYITCHWLVFFFLSFKYCIYNFERGEPFGWKVTFSRVFFFFSFRFCVGGRISAEMLTALNYVQIIYSLIIFYTDASCLNNGEQINIYGYFFSLFFVPPTNYYVKTGISKW